MKNKILIYGANGYTGKLFANFLYQKGIEAILSGRCEKVKVIGEKLGWESRIFPTDSAVLFLSDVKVVVNLAGPFSKTQAGLIQACIESGTDYLDIAGEVPELASAFNYDAKAKAANIKLMPGAGFGVVPTDIAAKLAAEALPDPHKLQILYATEGGASRGTLHTVLKDIQKAGIEIVDGKTVKALPSQKEAHFMLGKKRIKAVYNPWRADLFTAPLSTSIPNIECYSVFPGFVVSMMKGKLNWLRKLMLNYVIKLLPEGPSPKQLSSGSTLIEARVENQLGEKAQIRIEGPEAYQFTIECLYAVLQKIDELDQTGFIYPSLFGKELIEEIEGVKIELN